MNEVFSEIPPIRNTAQPTLNSAAVPLPFSPHLLQNKPHITSYNTMLNNNNNNRSPANKQHMPSKHDKAQLPQRRQRKKYIPYDQLFNVSGQRDEIESFAKIRAANGARFEEPIGCHWAPGLHQVPRNARAVSNFPEVLADYIYNRPKSQEFWVQFLFRGFCPVPYLQQRGYLRPNMDKQKRAETIRGCVFFAFNKCWMRYMKHFQRDLGPLMKRATWKPFESEETAETYDILLQLPVEAHKPDDMWDMIFKMVWAILHFNQHMQWMRNEEKSELEQGQVLDWSNPLRNVLAKDCCRKDIPVLGDTGSEICNMFGPHMRGMGMLTLNCAVLDIKGLPPMNSKDPTSTLMLCEELSEILNVRITTDLVELHLSPLINHESKKFMPSGSCTVYVPGTWSEAAMDTWKTSAAEQAELGSAFQLTQARSTNRCWFDGDGAPQKDFPGAPTRPWDTTKLGTASKFEWIRDDGRVLVQGRLHKIKPNRGRKNPWHGRRRVSYKDVPGQSYIGVIKNRFHSALELEVSDEPGQDGQPMIVRATKFDNDHIDKWSATKIGDVCSFNLTVGRDNRLLVVNLRLLKAGQRVTLEDHAAVINHDHARGADYVDSVVAQAVLQANGAREQKEPEAQPEAYDVWLSRIKQTEPMARTKEDIVPVLRKLQAIVITQKLKYPENSTAAIRCIGIALDNLAKDVNARFVARTPSGMGDVGLDCSWPWVTVSLAEELWSDSLSPQDDEQRRWRTMFLGDRDQHDRVLAAQARRAAQAQHSQQNQQAALAKQNAIAQSLQRQQQQLAELDRQGAEQEQDAEMANNANEKGTETETDNNAVTDLDDVDMSSRDPGAGTKDSYEALL